MKTMRASYRALVLALGLLSVAPVGAAEAPWTKRDARELVPAGLIGPWKADIAASTFSTKPPKKALRFFAYTGEGKVLVTFMSLTGDDKFVSGHWAAQVDGSPALEYHSSAGSTPFNVVHFTKIDEHNFKLVVERNGVVSIRATYVLAEDGKTLTYAYEGNRIVYHRWDMMD